MRATSESPGNLRQSARLSDTLYRYASRLEGNTYSLLETERLLQLGEAAAGKDAQRVSRLAANLPFIRRNLSPLSFVDVPERAYVDAIVGVYELNRVELLRDVFVWAYERSCARYSAVRQSIGKPDPFRFRYREIIGRTVADIVLGKMNKTAANAFIEKQASTKFPATDQARFKEIAATELMALHEGNIARYRLRPSEYREWRETWT